MIDPIFGSDVLKNAALWSLERLPDDKKRLHSLFKVLWFADLKHMKKYGRTITGDRYIAMNKGPVPSALYDIIKGNCPPELRGCLTRYDKGAEKGFLRAELASDERYLSETDKEALLESIEENKNLSFDDRVNKSHGHAWKSAYASGSSTTIRPQEILDEIGADSSLREYVLEDLELRKVLA